MSSIDSRGISTYQTNGSVDDLFKIFKFAADNTNVEWSIHRGSGNEYVIGTSHKQSEVSSYSCLSGNALGSVPVASIHSHPNIGITTNDEYVSMGYDEGYVVTGNDYYHFLNGNSPVYNYVYFPASGRLYNVEKYRPRFIKKIGTSFKGFYFGTLNYR